MYRRTHYLILGLGSYPEGSGISAVRFLLSRGARLTITDKKTARELARPVRAVLAAWRRAPKGTPRPVFVFGRHRLADVTAADVVVRNPGVPTRSPLVTRALSLGTPVENDVTLFVKHCSAPIVAVTGTRGKSTTAAWIADMLRRSGRRVLLRGNISTSPLALHTPRADIVVLELSSWQLEDMGRQKWHPQIAVVTNVLRDHLNTYPSMDAYAEAKAQIFQHQTSADILVVNRDNPWTRRFGLQTASRRLWTSLRQIRDENGVFVERGMVTLRENGLNFKIVHVHTFGLPGEHNLQNGLAAIAAAHASGASLIAIRSSLRTFAGLPSRQELVRTVRGVRYVNDTTATTPDATIAALRRFGKVGVLIAGGTDKNLRFHDVVHDIKRRVRVLILLPGTATVKMIKGIKMEIVPVNSMPDAVRAAAEHARRGEVVLLSPGAASFGLFKNEFDRGNQFVREVNMV